MLFHRTEGVFTQATPPPSSPGLSRHIVERFDLLHGKYRAVRRNKNGGAQARIAVEQLGLKPLQKLITQHCQIGAALFRQAPIGPAVQGCVGREERRFRTAALMPRGKCVRANKRPGAGQPVWTSQLTGRIEQATALHIFAWREESIDSVADQSCLRRWVPGRVRGPSCYPLLAGRMSLCLRRNRR